MSILFNYLWRFWFLLLSLVLLLICFLPVFLLSISKKHYPYAYWWIRFFCIVLFYGMGFRYQIHYLGQKKMEKDKPYVIIANHTSLMDILLTVVLHPHHPLCFVGKKELEKIPLFGIIYRRIAVLVDRQSPRSRAKVYPLCADRVKEGNSIVIFPEGGVPDDESVILDDFKDGAFILASKYKVPIAVYTFVGLKEMFPFSYSKGFPGRVQVYMNDILPTDLSAKELKSISHASIKKVLERTI